MVGMKLGRMHQLSNNLHLYLETADRVGTPAPVTDPYGTLVPLFGDLSAHDPRDILDEIEQLWEDNIDGEVEILPATTIQLIGGMRRAWEGWKAKDMSIATSGLTRIANSGHNDWFIACFEWLDRRAEKFS